MASACGVDGSECGDADQKDWNYFNARYNQQQCDSGQLEGCNSVGSVLAFTAVGLATAGVGQTAIEAAAAPILEAGTTVTGAACADGDCTNEINTGINVVYQLVEDGVTHYVGITNDFFRRSSEHLSSRGWAIETIPGLENLSRFDARAVEQLLIEYYGLGNLYNHINSISQANPIYHDSIQRATTILNSINFFNYP